MHDGETRFRFPHEFKGRLALTGREILRKRHGEQLVFKADWRLGPRFCHDCVFPAGERGYGRTRRDRGPFRRQYGLSRFGVLGGEHGECAS